MSLWKRNQKENFGQYKQVSHSGGPVSVCLSNPDSEQFDKSGCDSPRFLTRYMLAMQKGKFDRTILDSIKLPALERHCKLLMEKYGGLEVKKAVKIAADYAQHPFSFKLVEGILCQKKK